MASAKFSGHTPKRLHPVGKLEGAWEMEQKRSLREIEREREREKVKGDMMKEMERREERKKRGALRAQPAARTPFRGKESACALRVHWLLVNFNAYSDCQIKQKTFREREATAVQFCSQIHFSEETQPACALRVEWLVFGFNAYSERQIKYKIFREREATSVHHRQPSVCNFCLLLRRGRVVVPKRERSAGPVSRPQHNSHDHIFLCLALL